MVKPASVSQLIDNIKAYTQGKGVSEFRGIGCTEKYRPRPHVKAGFFDADHLKEAATAAFNLSVLGARGVYLSLNEVIPDLLARMANRVDVIGDSGPVSACDANIASRRWILFDFDTIRAVSGVSATDAEKAACREVVDKAIGDFRALGWEDPLFADSGNGFHLLFKVDLPNNEESTALVRNCLRAAGEKYNCEFCEVDPTVYNASRIVRLPGTIAAKADSTETRPHRRAEILRLNDSSRITSVERLREFAATAPPEESVVSAKGSNGKASRRSSGGRGRGTSDPVKAATAYLAKVPPSVAGQHGHDQLYHAASVLIDGFDLSTDDALRLLSVWNETCQPPWTEPELLRKLEEVEKKEGRSGQLLRGSHAPVSVRSASELLDLTGLESQNGEESQQPRPHSVICNGEEDGESGVVPIPMHNIIRSIQEATGGGVKRKGSSLFVHRKGNPRVDWIKSPSSLISWIGVETMQAPIFYRSPGCHSKDEVFEEFRRSAIEFKEVEYLPHEPPIPGHYYACSEIPPGNGDALSELIDRFNPETPIDRDLIIAMLATPFWGGPGGSRPVFLITSDQGRGSGKSTLARVPARLTGGAIEFTAGTEIEKIKTRLLSDGGLGGRVALIDNIKTLRFSWAEWEGLVTAPSVSGHQLYAGEASRPNHLTWIITLNGVALSKDVAQRVVTIKINRPEHCGDWEDSLGRHIEEHHQEIIADLLEFLKSEPLPLSRYTRWGRWERDVLARLPDPNEAQQVVIERQNAVDVEEEEFATIEEYFEEQLSNWYKPEVEQIFIPTKLVAEWFSKATGERTTTVKATTQIKQAIREGTLKFLSICVRHDHGRGLIWTGPGWKSPGDCHWDIEERISKLQENNHGRGF